MGGFFGAISKRDCVLDIFFGVDYHSHLGTRRGGMIVYDRTDGFQRQIHNIENTPFRTKFEKDITKFHGASGIGCISDTDPQPLLVRSHLGLFAITTVGIINNADALVDTYFTGHGRQFMAMSSGAVNATELIAALINQKDSLVEGIRYAQEAIDGSATILILTPGGIVAARDKLGRLPVLIGQSEEGCCVSFESFAYHKLGYEDAYELGPQEIVKITPEGWETLSPAGKDMRICAFLWTYYGYPNSNYEGVNVEVMRYRNGEIMARNEIAGNRLPNVDYVAGVPDSGSPETPTQPQQPAAETIASPSNDGLEVNGAVAVPTVYKINDSNYFKIRDVAAMLNGTEKQFSVGYDGTKNAVTATTGEGYDRQSGDLEGPAKGGRSADPSNDAIYVNGEKITAEVYKINGSNYFKLRDLGKALNFYVGWSADRGMYIETNKAYSE